MPKPRNVLRWFVGLEPTIPPQPTGGDFPVTAIVPCFNEATSIGDTIRSLQRQTCPPVAIIVVDDCSTDGTATVARTAGAVVVRTPRNTGKKVSAQNWGLDQVRTPLFVVVDGDTVLAPDALELLVRWMRIPTVSVVCGYVLPQKIETVWERVRLVDYVYGCAIFKNAQNHIGAVLVASGCFSLFRTEQIRAMGGFPDTGTFAEDMEVSWRILEEGGQVRFESRAHCFALDPPTWQIYQRQMDRWFRGFLQCFRNRGFLGVWKHKRLGAVISFQLWDAVFGPLLMVGGLAWYFSNILTGLLLYFFIDFCFPVIVCLYKGARLGKLGMIVGSLPCIPLLRVVNPYLFYRAIWKQVIRGGDLTTWEKGH